MSGNLLIKFNKPVFNPHIIWEAPRGLIEGKRVTQLVQPYESVKERDLLIQAFESEENVLSVTIM